MTQYPATENKLNKEKEEGNILKSHYLPKIISLFSYSIFLVMMFEYVWVDIKKLVKYGFINSTNFSFKMLYQFLSIAFIPLSLAGLAGLLAEIIQVRPKVFTKQLKLDFNRISPKNYLKNFKKHFFLGLNKVIFSSIILFSLFLVLILKNQSLALLTAGIIYIIFLLTDFLITKNFYLNSLKMTRHEVFREQKELEVNSELKMLQRNRHKELKDFDVVIKKAKFIVVN